MPFFSPPHNIEHPLGCASWSSTSACPLPTTTSTEAATMPSQKTAAAAVATATATTAPKKKPSASSIFSLKCGCKDAKSVSISNSCSDGSEKAAEPGTTSLSGTQQGAPTMSARPETSSADTINSTTATTSTSHEEEEEEEEEEEDDTPSFSGLLRQLSELERSIAAWDRRRRAPSGWVSSVETVETEDEEGKSRRGTNIGGYDSGCSQKQGQRHRGHGRHRRSHSEGGSIDRRVLGKVGESVAVVQQTEDPLGDFRRSMLQMIVEKEILSGEELRQLLFSFLALNSPSHHPLIIRAFADIWRDVFSGYSDDSAADLILPPPFPRHRLSNYVRNRRYS